MMFAVIAQGIMRKTYQDIDGFRPYPRGDPGWLLRTFQDRAVKYMRVLIAHYWHLFAENVANFVKRALSLVRLLYEEGFRRCLLAAKDAMRKRALCALMVTMHFYERQHLVHEGMSHMTYFPRSLRSI